MAVMLSVLVAGCGASNATANVVVPSSTIAGVGVLPGPLSDASQRSSPQPVEASIAEDDAAVRPADLGLPSIGQLAQGKRVIVIGDSILASTSPRFGGSLCDRLVEAGWDVEIDAEPGRFITFADKVLDARFHPDAGLDWDAVVMFFGSNYSGSRTEFESSLRALLERVQPRPVVLLTVTEFQTSRVAVNDTIRDVAGESDAIHVIDWARITEAEPGLLAYDGLHLSQAGKNRITTEIVLALGTSPTFLSESSGQCLETLFTDDELPVPDDGS